jgi:hypothetical protein
MQCPHHSNPAPHFGEARLFLEARMNPDTLNEPLAAATAAARRVLVQAIDLRFDLDEAAEAAAGGSVFLREALRRLSAAAVTLQREIDRLAAALEPEPDGRHEILEEEQDETMVSYGD